jgi:hypothetical protein
MDLVKRLLLLVTLLAVALPGQAGAAGTPCRNKIVSDWTRDGKIASSYPVACYRDALKHIPADADIYSSLRNDVRAAMRAAIRRTQGLAAPSVVGQGFKDQPRTSSVKSEVTVISAPNRHDPPSGGVGALAGDASGAPLPILVLGGIALALVAAGAIGVGVRHARGRRSG